MTRKPAPASLLNAASPSTIPDTPNWDAGTANPDKKTSRVVGSKVVREPTLTRRKMLTILAATPLSPLAASPVFGAQPALENHASPAVLKAIAAYEAAWQAFEDICPVMDRQDHRFDPSRHEEYHRLDEAEVEARVSMLASPMFTLADFVAKANSIAQHSNGELGTLDCDFLDALIGSVRG